MPLITVIVPNYNHEAYLQHRLESIFSQTFKDFDVIILDDCSTDKSRDIIESFRSQFASILEQGNMELLLKRMTEHNTRNNA